MTSELDLLVKRNNYLSNYILPDNIKDSRELMHYKGIPFMQVYYPISMDVELLLQEAKQFDKNYVPHRSNKESHAGWSAVVLHGISSLHTLDCTAYGYTKDNAPMKWTDIAAMCPNILNFLNVNFPYTKFERVRIMRLEPGGYIAPHIDGGDFDHLGPINIAINNPQNCNFFMDGYGILPFADGTAMSLNIGSKTHFVLNNSNENRYHIILHGSKGKKVTDMIYKSYKKIKGYNE